MFLGEKAAYLWLTASHDSAPERTENRTDPRVFTPALFKNRDLTEQLWQNVKKQIKKPLRVETLFTVRWFEEVEQKSNQEQERLVPEHRADEGRWNERNLFVSKNSVKLN